LVTFLILRAQMKTFLQENNNGCITDIKSGVVVRYSPVQLVGVRVPLMPL